MYIVIVTVLLTLWALNVFMNLNAVNTIRQSVFQKTYSNFKQYLWPSWSVGFLASDLRIEFLSLSRLWRSQIWDLRRFLFSSAQGIFGLFWLLLCFTLFYEVNSYWVVLIALIISIAGTFKKLINYPVVYILKPIIFFSLVLFFLELSFKNSSMLMQFLMDTEIVFFTTIDSKINLLVMLCVSTIFGFIIPVQGWSLVFTFILFLNSQLSYLGFVFIIVGEFLGMSLFWRFSIKSWDVQYKKKIIGLLNWILGYLIIFLAGVYIWRQVVSLGPMYNQLFILKWIYLSTVVVFLFGLYATFMVWGHFNSGGQGKNVVPEVAGSDLGLINELGVDDIDPITQFIREQLRLRRNKLVQFKSELDSDHQSKAKIPPFVLNQFETEISFIDRLKIRN